MEKNENNMTRTQVFNVIILDKSGSMESIREAAIVGFNETLAGIKKAQMKYMDTQEHFVSLHTFCSCIQTFVFDKVPVEVARPLRMEDYKPCCCTPLYDAMGYTLTSMRKFVQKKEDYVVVVTIITDGLENDSKEYTRTDVRKLVEELRGEGWSFTYMGTNQDSMEIALSLSIRNARNFDYSYWGTMTGMNKDSCTRLNFFDKLARFKEDDIFNPFIPREERRTYYTEMVDEAFDEEEERE